jgi:hypothetical protein
MPASTSSRKKGAKNEITPHWHDTRTSLNRSRRDPANPQSSTTRTHTSKAKCTSSQPSSVSTFVQRQRKQMDTTKHAYMVFGRVCVLRKVWERRLPLGRRCSKSNTPQHDESKKGDHEQKRRKRKNASASSAASRWTTKWLLLLRKSNSGAYALLHSGRTDVRTIACCVLCMTSKMSLQKNELHRRIDRGLGRQRMRVILDVVPWWRWGSCFLVLSNNGLRATCKL